MKATPGNITAILIHAGYKQSAKGRYGFKVEQGGDSMIIVTHVPADARMAVTYCRILKEQWQCSQVGTHVVVRTQERK